MIVNFLRVRGTPLPQINARKHNHSHKHLTYPLTSLPLRLALRARQLHVRHRLLALLHRVLGASYRLLRALQHDVVPGQCHYDIIVQARHHAEERGGCRNEIKLIFMPCTVTVSLDVGRSKLLLYQNTS